MRLNCTIIAVKDIERSKKFYKDLFDQNVVIDLGTKVTLSGGFELQQISADFWGIDSTSIIEKSNNMELFFEEENFTEFEDKLAVYDDVSLVHTVKEYSWNQRVIRVYDPDYHIIEIVEAMSTVAKRLLSQGYTVEETAEKMQHPIAFVMACQGGMI